MALARFNSFKLGLDDGLCQIYRWESLQADWLLVRIQIQNDLDHGEKWSKRTAADLYRQMSRPAEILEAAGLIDRGSTSMTLWPGRRGSGS